MAPSQLARFERVELMRQAAAALAKGDCPSPYAASYLGQALLRWLAGEDFERAAGVRPPRGSRKRASVMLRQAERDRLIVRFAAAVGSDRRAALVLRGEQACPPNLTNEAQTLRAQGAPKSASGIWKVRQRVSSHRA